MKWSYLQDTPGGKVTHRYGAVLNVRRNEPYSLGQILTPYQGFAANIPKNFLNNLQGDSLIKYVGSSPWRCPTLQ